MFTRIVGALYVGAIVLGLAGCQGQQQSAPPVAAAPAMAMAPLSVDSGPTTIAIPSGVLKGAQIKFAPLDVKQAGAVPEVVGGKVADASQWPASFAATIVANGKWYLCTATLIGPQALLTAGHCVADHGTVSIEFRGKTQSAICSHHPKFDSTWDQDVEDGKHPSWDQRKNGVSADFALCHLPQAINEVTYETPLINPAQVANAKSILLAGYGCYTADKQPSINPATGKPLFQTGYAQIASLPKDDYLYILTGTGAQVCPGDSGGAAYLTTSSSLDDVGGRRVVAVNSRVGTQDNKVVGPSYLSSLATSSASAFLKKWSADNGAAICGYNQPTQCRSF